MSNSQESLKEADFITTFLLEKNSFDGLYFLPSNTGSDKKIQIINFSAWKTYH